MYNPSDIVVRIKECAKLKKINIKDMLSCCNLGINTLSNMKHGKALASDSLAKIADYLDVSVDYLLGRDKFVGAAVQTTKTAQTAPARSGNSTANDFTVQEIEFIKDLRSLDLKDKFEVMKALNNAKERREFPENSIRNKEA